MSRLLWKASAVFACSFMCLSLRQMHLTQQTVFQKGVLCLVETFFRTLSRVMMSSGAISSYKSPAAWLENFWRKALALCLVLSEKLFACTGSSCEIESW